MLHLVPFTGAGWEVADLNRKANLVSQGLQFQLPQPWSMAVAAAGVGRDDKFVSFRIQPFALKPPPPSN